MKPFDRPTLISLLFSVVFCINGQTEQQQKNLDAFSKLYGYVKYFHPSDEAYALDWDTFAIYGAQQMLLCSSEEETLSTLKSLFEPIAPSVRIFRNDESKKYDLSILTPEEVKKFKVVYWQHKGVSFGMEVKKSPYQSIRVNTKSEINLSDSFGNLINSIDGKPYAGTKIKYSAWVKVSKAMKGTGHLWFRVDNNNGTRGAFNNMMDTPIKSTTGWQKFEIVEEVGTILDKIVFGAFLMGEGTMWVDDVNLSYNKDGEWKNIPIDNSSFEITDKKEITGWNTNGEGYSFKVDGNQSVHESSSIQIQYKGKTKQIKGDQLFDHEHAIGDIYEASLSDGISCQIPLALLSDAVGTFPRKDVFAYEQLIKEVKDAPKEASKLAFKLGNVIQVYNVFQHFYPYFEEVKVAWHKEFMNALSRSYNDQNLKDHVITLEKFTAKLRDGHIRVLWPDAPRFRPPITWEWVEGKLVITHVYDELSLAVGDIVTHIDGRPSEDYFEEIRSRISAGTNGWLEYRAKTSSLLGPENSTMMLKVDGQDIELVRTLTYSSIANRKKKSRYKLLDNGIVYLNLDLIEMDTINKLMPTLDKSRAIICDLRGYPKGNHGLISHLLKSNDTTAGWMKVPQIIFPNQERIAGYESFQWNLRANKPHLGDKNVIFITNGQAISYAESFMGYIEGYNLATIIGQPTAGTNGNINYFNLPGEIRIIWTGMKVVKHDGTQHHGVGVLPDVRISKTIQGVKEGRDEFFEKALELALKK